MISMKENPFDKLAETDLQPFGIKIKNELAIMEKETPDRIHLLLLCKLFQIEKNLSDLQKHVMTPLTH